MVDGGQADVLVHPAVASDVVGVEQLVVVEAWGYRAAGHGVGILQSGAPVWLSTGLAANAMSLRKAWPVRTALTRLMGAAGFPSTSARWCRQRSLHHHLDEPVRAAQEVAVGVGGEQRHVVKVPIREIDPEEVRACAFRPAQVAIPPRTTSSAVPKWPSAPRSRFTSSLPGSHRLAGGVQLIGPQEHLVRGVRAVGLVLVHERRVVVDVLVDVVGGAEHAVGAGQHGGPRQHHEVRSRLGPDRTADHRASAG